MMSEYKQSYVIVMENGDIVKWTGYAESNDLGEGLAVTYAKSKYNNACRVWDTANRPVRGK